MKVDPLTFHMLRKLLSEAGTKAWHLKGGAAAFRILTHVSNGLVCADEVADNNPGEVAKESEGTDSCPSPRTDNL